MSIGLTALISSGHKRSIPFEQLSGDDIVKRWKSLAGARIWAFAKNHSPLKVKLSGRYLYVDSDSISNAIVLEGIVPYASEMKGWKGPLNGYVSARPHPVKLFYGWKTVSKKRKLTKSPGVEIRDVQYYGGHRPSLGYFGLKQDGGVRSYGMTPQSYAVPVYSNQSVVEWLTQEQMTEVLDLIKRSFAEVSGWV